MSTIVLEQIEPEIREEPEQIVPEEPDLPGESVEQEAVLSVPEPTPTETPAPAPKKRGRPPKAKVEAPPPAPKVKVAAPKPKAVRKPKPPVEESSDSSDVDSIITWQNQIWKRRFWHIWSIENRQNLQDVGSSGEDSLRCEIAFLMSF